MCDAHIENCVARSWNKRTFVDFLDLLARDAKEQGIEIRDASWRWTKPQRFFEPANPAFECSFCKKTRGNLWDLVTGWRMCENFSCGAFLRIILNSGDHRQYALGAAKKLPHGWVVHNKEIMPERKL